MKQPHCSIGIVFIVFLSLFAVGGVFADSLSYDIRTRLEGDKRFFTIEARDADLRDVLRALAHQSGLNIILGEGVTGKVTLSFKDILFRDALEIVMRAHGFGYAIKNNVIWVGKKEELVNVGDELDEMVSEVIQLKYADPSSVVSQIKGVLGQKGSVTPDARINSIVVRDIRKNIDEVKKLLSILDVQTLQVMIEARIVEASTNFARELGVQWGGRYASGGDAVRGSALLPASTGGRNFAVNMPAIFPTSGVGIVVGSLSNNLVLDLELSAAERRGELKIVSQPRIAALNNKPATIHSGVTFRVKVSQSILVGQETGTGVGGALGATTGGLAGVEEFETGIDLTVTPNISADDFVLLNISTKKSDLDFSRTVDGIPLESEKSASTSVFVKDGDTVVIGGLYRSSSSDRKDSVPFFGNIPLLGWLFKNRIKTSDDEELLVFITPKIVKYPMPKAAND